MRVVPKHRLVLGQAIRKHRQEAGWSQEKLAERADLSTVFTNRVESGKENISVDAVVCVAQALEVARSGRSGAGTVE